MVSDLITRTEIDAELQPGETVLWAGKPQPGRIALQNRQALVTGVMAVAALYVVLTGFAAASVFSFLIFGCGFTWLAALFMLLPFYYFTRPVYEYLMAGRTIYAVTDRRVLIVKPRFGGKTVQSYSRIEQIERRDLSGGKGDLIFASEQQAARSRSRPRRVGFFGIPNPREVERLMLGIPGEPRPSSEFV